MAVERADADSGAARHRFQAGVRAAGAEDGLGGLQQALAVANRIGARPSGVCGDISHEIRLFAWVS